MNRTQIQFLEDVNTDLREALALASFDYTEANTLLKQLYSCANSTSEMAMKAETIMTSLQYMDIFSQRMEHLILVHQKIVHENLSENFMESFFHLHVYQALTIELDLIHSITLIKTLFSDLSHCFVEPERELFHNTAFVKTQLEKTIQALLDAGGELHRLPIPPLTSTQIDTLNSLYTMERERAVLRWFLDSIPHGTWHELQEYYKEEINQVSSDAIELF